MGEAAHIPADGHLVKVDRYAFGYVVTHTSNQRMIYTATYHTRMDALRSANRIADSERADGHDVYLQVSPDVHFG